MESSQSKTQIEKRDEKQKKISEPQWSVYDLTYM